MVSDIKTAWLTFAPVNIKISDIAVTDVNIATKKTIIVRASIALNPDLLPQNNTNKLNDDSVIPSESRKLVSIDKKNAPRTAKMRAVIAILKLVCSVRIIRRLASDDYLGDVGEGASARRQKIHTWLASKLADVRNRPPIASPNPTPRPTGPVASAIAATTLAPPIPIPAIPAAIPKSAASQPPPTPETSSALSSRRPDSLSARVN